MFKYGVIRKLMMAKFADFEKLDIRVGTIVKASFFEKARKPAYQLEIDFSPEIGLKKSSAQITQCYSSEELINKQILAIINFPPKQIANFVSEVLVLGVYAQQGIILVSPLQQVKNGDKLG